MEKKMYKTFNDNTGIIPFTALWDQTWSWCMLYICSACLHGAEPHFFHGQEQPPRLNLKLCFAWIQMTQIFFLFRSLQLNMSIKTCTRWPFHNGRAHTCFTRTMLNVSMSQLVADDQLKGVNYSLLNTLVLADTFCDEMILILFKLLDYALKIGSTRTSAWVKSSCAL